LRVKKAASAKKTNARGDSSPAAEPGAVVEDAACVAEVVLDPLDVEPEDVVFEPLDVDPVELEGAEEPVEVVEEPEEVVEAPEEVEPLDVDPEAEADMAVDVAADPPINWT